MFPLTDAALNLLGKKLVLYLKNRIRAKYPYGNPEIKGVSSKIATGDLLNSISYELIKGKQGQPSVIEIKYLDYFEYVNKGRKPKAKKVPIKALLQWITVKGLRGRNKKGRFIKKMSLAYAIQTNIYKYGIRPKKQGNLFYDPAIERLEQLLDNPPQTLQAELNGLFDAMDRDINNLIEQRIVQKIINTK